ncbi:UBX domain-containing protein 10 [Microcaecilia unicolor]|uniref:UBX domain-containing protein 10 n=1 Tax=Microcaecilia unicolor TaxID=1415580 RepID=A0A6P7WN74_9AMPH|nr:UBX domain-containing protein 10 [Microcaecilia unicolor]XP_030041789.1 UBX domain-containing protein 10 [Microcaecilia unicolor]XP_030041790.1 UBX domain-containing protein 10 [Microcaecilia unicolor]
MAAAPPDHITTSGSIESFAWQPDTVSMHVTRPKSAKGRTRSNLSYSHNVEAYSYQVPSPPQPAVSYDVASSLRTSASATRQPLTGVCKSQAEIPELLNQVPSRPSSSLNKYRVLPSIEKKGSRGSIGEKITEQFSTLKLTKKADDQHFKPVCKGNRPASAKSEGKGTKGAHSKSQGLISEKPLLTADGMHLNLEEPSEEPRLLLAVRSPSGERFEHYFRPRDSLQTVLMVAENKTTCQYKDCIIETVEVPRRSFFDLTMSLQECGISNKSVLCILQAERD